ncbi:MAG: ATP-binding cassette domain-containing protein [Nannocystaceae bacterium]
MIEARHLAKRFGDVVAVADVSFTARDGEITGLLGPNGAGKTTTLRMIYGLIRPDRGEARVDGDGVEANPLRAAGRMGVLPDAQGLYPRLTAREHIQYFARLQGLDGAPLQRRVQHLLERLDMASIADRRAQGFSQGERMKTNLARALVHEPRNVLLDEPTNGLDVMSIRGLRDLIRRLKDEGRCVLFSSHVMQEVSALCDQIVIVSEGRIVARGTPDQLREQTGEASLEDAFVALTGPAGPAGHRGGGA